MEQDTLENTNYVYDLNNWIPEKIPQTINQITFVGRFNENCKELFSFKNLTINLCKYYTNYDLLKNDMTNIINKNELMMTIVTNNIYAKTMRIIRDKAQQTGDREKQAKNYYRCFDYEHEHCMLRFISLSYYIMGISIEDFHKLDGADTFYNIPGLLETINVNIDKSNEYESKLYFESFEQSTSEYLIFLQFFVTKIVGYFRHSRQQ